MKYDREVSFYNANCLDHDVVDIFNMVSDCALEPRNFNSADVGIHKLPNSYKYETSANGWSAFTDKVFNSIYGTKGLGMPLWGD